MFFIESVCSRKMVLPHLGHQFPAIHNYCVCQLILLLPGSMIYYSWRTSTMAQSNVLRPALRSRGTSQSPNSGHGALLYIQLGLEYQMYKRKWLNITIAPNPITRNYQQGSWQRWPAAKVGDASCCKAWLKQQKLLKILVIF